MNYSVLVLEDNPDRIIQFKRRFLESGISDYDFVDNFKDCIEKLSIKIYYLVFADHDLGGETYVSTSEENSGSGVVRWMVENDNNTGAIVVVHSLNPAGRKNMMHMLESKYDCYEIPFVWTKDVFHKAVRM